MYRIITYNFLKSVTLKKLSQSLSKLQIPKNRLIILKLQQILISNFFFIAGHQKPNQIVKILIQLIKPAFLNNLPNFFLIFLIVKLFFLVEIKLLRVPLQNNQQNITKNPHNRFKLSVNSLLHSQKLHFVMVNFLRQKISWRVIVYKIPVRN